MNVIYLVKVFAGVNACNSKQDAEQCTNRIGCWPKYYSNCPDRRYKYVTLNCNKYIIEWVQA